MPTEVEVPKKQSQSQEETSLTMKRHFRRYAALRAFAIVAMLLAVLYIAGGLFGPTPEYRLASVPTAEITSPDFLRQIESIIDSRIEPNTSVEFLPNGERFYEAELAAIREAKSSVNIEAYLWKKGEVTQRFLDVLAERARAGVKVRIVVDGVGNWMLRKKYFEPVTKAGGQVEWYHPMRWHTLFRSNNRTHREIVVVDGTIAFVGGAGFGDHWLKAEDDNPRWRDNMFLVRGEAVRAIQAAFIENWLEASGELLNGSEFFPPLPAAGAGTSMVVASSPTNGGSTHARVLYQILLGSAKRSIDINTPYFVPDSNLIDALKAAAGRGVRVRVTVPGEKIDHAVVRYTSRRMFGDLIAAGVEIYEYQPSMNHSKVLMIDGTWAVLGTTNLDHRSFGLNDEINMAVMDPALLTAMAAQYEADLADSRRVTMEDWKSRGVIERVAGTFGWIFKRQQ